MSIYVNKNNGFQQAESLSRECPHCGAHAQLLPIATPSFEALTATRPRHAGIVFRCAACNEPRFVRLAVRAFEPERVELAPNVVEIERPRERFQFSYLPPDIEPLLREALDCHTAGHYNAFAALSRRCVETALAGSGPLTRRRWSETLREIVELAGIREPAAHAVEAVLLGSGPPPLIGPDEAAVLIEAVKDLFYQGYVRTAKLKAAMQMRRYFAGEQNGKITPIDRGRRERA